MSDPMQLAILAIIVAGFAAFAVTLFVVSISVNLPQRRPARHLARPVVAASRPRTYART